MKKIFTLVVSALLAGSAFAQDVPYILSAVGDNTYAVTKTQEEIAAAYSADWVSPAWNMGVNIPDGTVMFENDDLTIKAAPAHTTIYTSSGKITQIKEEHPGYTGYINLGSTLGQSIDPENDIPENFSDWSASANNNAMVIVTPKKKGTLSFGVYAGDNSRSIGIFRIPTEADKAADDYGEWVACNNFRNDGENGTVKNAPAFAQAEVEPGHDFVLVGGAKRNLCLHEIKFVPAGSSSISSALTNGKAKVAVGYYNAAGAQVNGLQKGLNIVKYSDGTAAKIIK